MTEHAVICRTSGCGNEGVEVVVTFGDVDVEHPTPSSVICGPCGAVITDITEVTV